MFHGKGIYDEDETYVMGYVEGINMFIKDPKGYRAYIETIPKESSLHKGLLDGKTSAIELMKKQNMAYHAEEVHAMAFNAGYGSKYQKELHEKTRKQFKDRGDALLQGFEAGARLHEIDQKRLTQKAEDEALGKKKTKGKRR